MMTIYAWDHTPFLTILRYTPYKLEADTEDPVEVVNEFRK